jgi:predicted lipoprotein with Yx(FWY)xxD motif
VPATVGVASTRLGNVLDNPNGHTLYLFKRDSATSSCTGACARAWPPLRASGHPAAGKGANALLLGTTPRSDGKRQVSYNGHPLYTFTGDQNPGDTSGHRLRAFGARWYAVSPAVKQVTGPRGSR